MNQTKPTYKQQGNVGLFDSDETMEKLNKLGNPLDKLSFRDFLGLASGDKVPDEKTIWAFKEELTKKGLFGQLFDEFYAFLEENNLIMHEGTMIDGSFVEAPRQHNTRKENKLIKEDRGGELWNPEEGDTEEEKRRKANKKRQKDTDARWVKKGGLQHPDKPGLQPVPARANNATRNELIN